MEIADSLKFFLLLALLLFRVESLACPELRSYTSRVVILATSGYPSTIYLKASLLSMLCSKIFFLSSMELFSWVAALFSH